MKMKLIFPFSKGYLILLIGFFSTFSVFAQNLSVKGNVKDANTGEPVIGATISIKGTTLGTISDVDGNFAIIGVPAGSVVVVSYIGYTTQEMAATSTPLSILMQEDAIMLGEVVAIGYGSVKKKDATGSVVAIKPDEMNKGLALAPQDLLAGKVAGVSIVGSGGQPGGSSTIRIRGGSSLSANNDPLIVIDGVVMNSGTVDGLSNPLSTVNPSDIESFTVLKDASATAIYGSRASNGVIIITTKKGKTGSVKFTYNGSMSVSTPRNKYDVMSGDEYRDFIKNYPEVTSKPSMITTLNQYPGVSTDWQDEIFRTALGTDQGLSAYGSIKDFMPYRVSLGYTNENGILKTSNFERYSGSLSLTPSFFDDHLKMNLNAKGIKINNQFADTGALGAAIAFDPTKPVMNGNSNYGGYFTWTTDGTPDGPKAASTTINPVSILEMKNDHSDVTSFIGNAQLDYKLHFFPDLKVNLNLAMENTSTDGQKYVEPNAPSNYGADPNRTGSNETYERTYKNNLLDIYGLYAKEINEDNRFDLMGGYSYQKYSRSSSGITYYLSRDPQKYGQNTDISSESPYSESNYVLISFYGRFNYTLKERYLLTLTLRDDASSRFSEDNRWGLFPSVALGWRINDEEFLKHSETLSNLKLRLGWGVTGQQDIQRGDYPYMNYYKDGKGGAMFPMYDAQGNVTWVNVLASTAANPNLKWEETTTWNVGLDYGFLNNRISGALDLYFRKTDDLINNEVQVPAGTNFAEIVPSNIGSLENKGIEFSIDAIPVQSKDLTWSLGFNIAYNKSKITQLTYNDANSTSPGKRFGDSGGDGSKTVKIHAVDNAPSSYYVYEQIYDEAGKPIEGAYVDRNNDGVINDKDLYIYRKPAADVLMGFNSKLIYKKWDLGFNGRVSLGNYNYNSMAANSADLSTSGVFAHGDLTNKPSSALYTNFQSRQRMSDYYVQNASFLKIDNITLGYTADFGKVTPRFYATVQNPVLITKYDGLDPEVTDGMDNNVYPRPLMFIFGVNLNF